MRLSDILPSSNIVDKEALLKIDNLRFPVIVLNCKLSSDDRLMFEITTPDRPIDEDDDTPITKWVFASSIMFKEHYEINLKEESK